MKLRQCSYCDYGMTKPEAKELLEICKNADSDMEQIIFEAAQESNKMIANEIYFSLRNGVSYDRLFPAALYGYSKTDFYAYRRKTLFLLKEGIMNNNEVIQKHFVDTGTIRRFCKIEAAMYEFQVSRTTAINFAEEAKALVKFGHFYRIDMTKLYSYIDKMESEGVKMEKQKRGRRKREDAF